MENDLISRAWLLEQLDGLENTTLLKWSVLALVNNAPRVEVVRCKDCENYQETIGKDSGKPCGYGSCTSPFWITSIVYDEDFCSYGERRCDK